LLTAGHLFGTASSWLQNSLQGSRTESSERSTIKHLAKHAIAVAWLQQQLQDLQQHPTEAAAAGVPPELLQELCNAAEAFTAKADALSQLCSTALGMTVSDPAAEAAVFQACVQGCADGWLPEGLQQLGAKVWAAWPQKYACNDTRCLNLSGLTEESCAKLRCSGCKG
jgi:hypothetical protein